MRSHSSAIKLGSLQNLSFLSIAFTRFSNFLLSSSLNPSTSGATCARHKPLLFNWRPHPLLPRTAPPMHSGMDVGPQTCVYIHTHKYIYAVCTSMHAYVIEQKHTQLAGVCVCISMRMRVTGRSANASLWSE